MQISQQMFGSEAARRLRKREKKTKKNKNSPLLLSPAWFWLSVIGP